MNAAGQAALAVPPARVRCTILGCGTSIGVPVVGCTCEVCRSDDPRNQRMRVSVYVEMWHAGRSAAAPADQAVLVDTSPDLRQQLLRFRTWAIDEVFYTHTHADHIFGLDDLRPIHFFHKSSIVIRGRHDHLQTVQAIYPYAFRDARDALGPVPQLEAHALQAGEFIAGGFRLAAVEIPHGPRETVLGYRFGPMAYLTDVSEIPAAAQDQLQGVQLVVIGALRARPHTKHFSVRQAVGAARELGAIHVVLTHMGHELDYTAVLDQLQAEPLRAEPAYDGMVVTAGTADG